MITVIVRDPGQPARVERIEPTLAEFQRLVGGSIEAVQINGVPAYVNEDGVRLGLRPNVTLRERGDVVVGPVVLSMVDAAGEDIGVSAESVGYLRAMLDGMAVVEAEA